MRDVKIWFNGELVVDGKVDPQIFLGILYAHDSGIFEEGGMFFGTQNRGVPSLDQMRDMGSGAMFGGRYGDDSRGWVTFQIKHPEDI